MPGTVLLVFALNAASCVLGRIAADGNSAGSKDAGNTSMRYEGPEGSIAGQDIENALHTVLVNSPNVRAVPLGDLVNTGNLAEIIKNNSGYLDAYTRQYVNESSQGTIHTILDTITVVMECDLDTALHTVNQLGINIGENPEALTVGMTILLFVTMLTDSAGRITKQGDADLLGHEAIHALQALEAGGIASYAVRYRSYSNMAVRMGKDAYHGNSLETGAYNFGPVNVCAQRAGALQNPVFSRYGGWHR
jgi:hypothetical protein